MIAMVNLGNASVRNIELVLIVLIAVLDFTKQIVR